MHYRTTHFRSCSMLEGRLHLQLHSVIGQCLSIALVTNASKNNALVMIQLSISLTYVNMIKLYTQICGCKCECKQIEGFIMLQHENIHPLPGFVSIENDVFMLSVQYIIRIGKCCRFSDGCWYRYEWPLMTRPRNVGRAKL